jgi:multidrug efflux pump subunit AcrA (membrane-fusion protein)
MTTAMRIRFVFCATATAAALCLLSTGCDKPAAPSAMGGPGGFVPAVTVTQPTQRSIIEWDEYPGRLAAVAMVEVRARVSGYLQSIHFKDGAEVKKGDLLFVIDPRPYQAEMDRAEAELQQAQTRFELASNDLARAVRLLDSKAISEEEADSRNKASREAAAPSCPLKLHSKLPGSISNTPISPLQ